MPLPGEEIKTPQLVFQKLFDCYHFHEINYYLNDIKDWVINKNYPHSLNSREHDNTLFFFEKLQALVEAVYIVVKQNGVGEKQVEESSPHLFHSLFDKVDALYDAGHYLYKKKQNALCCYLLHKSALCAYNAIIIASNHSIEGAENVEELATSCSNIFKGLPSPFTSSNTDKKYLRLLNIVTLHKAMSAGFQIEDEVIEYLLKEVNIIRRDVCEYYEGRFKNK